MPMKFKPSEKIRIDPKGSRMRTVHHYMHVQPVETLQSALTSSNTQPKKKQKIRNELVRRGVEV